NALGGVILGAGTTTSVVSGNFIGPGADGKTRVGNGSDFNFDNSGVVVLADSMNATHHNIIGGDVPGAGNVIAFNQSAGVNVFGSHDDPSFPAAQNIAILGNRIFQNSQLGIALGTVAVPATPTPNDFQDPDQGPNDSQNYPVVTSALRNTSSSSTEVSGTLNSKTNTEYRIEFFQSG